MDISNSLKLQEPKKCCTKYFEFGALFHPMTDNVSGGRFAPTAIRMRAIRRASAHPTPEAFCNFLGISRSRLSNVEGGHPIGRQLQDIIVSKLPWISRGYLMDGDESAITSFTAQKLAPLLAEESDTTRSRSPRSASTKAGRG
jgi:hypothetical protein